MRKELSGRGDQQLIHSRMVQQKSDSKVAPSGETALEWALKKTEMVVTQPFMISQKTGEKFRSSHSRGHAEVMRSSQRGARVPHCSAYSQALRYGWTY